MKQLGVENPFSFWDVVAFAWADQIENPEDLYCAKGNVYVAFSINLLEGYYNEYPTIY